MSPDFTQWSHFLEHLPTEPGVYRMCNAAGDVLYVGKAINLKKRVSSYFNRAHGNIKTRALVQQISAIEITVTRTEADALVLESQLIKTLRPKYNVLMRDDKSYPYLVLSLDHPFPRVSMMRVKKKPDQPGYFGPYPGISAVRETLNMLQTVFKLRPCRDRYFNSRTRPCLQYQLKRCSAPCVDFISKEAYQQRVTDAMRFLQGKSYEIVEMLEKRMHQAVTEWAFEEAAHVRDQIKQLRVIQAQFGGFDDIDFVFECVASLAWMTQRWEALQAYLQFNQSILTMVCFDISHTQGVLPMASCVVFDEQGPVKSAYRRYGIEGITPGDDYAAMEQAVYRHIQRLMPDEYPQVMVIDGGRGQVCAAQKALDALNVQGIVLVGIAKGPTRKAGLEHLIRWDDDAHDFIEETLPSDSPALHLLQHIRDEAHRFAIQGHRAKRNQAGLSSSLTSIEGIGAKRRHALLQRFGGLRELAKASVDEIKTVRGISEALAIKIYQHFRSVG